MCIQTFTSLKKSTKYILFIFIYIDFKGGVGKGIANQDITASNEDDLMFFTGKIQSLINYPINPSINL